MTKEQKCKWREIKRLALELKQEGFTIDGVNNSISLIDEKKYKKELKKHHPVYGNPDPANYVIDYIY